MVEPTAPIVFIVRTSLQDGLGHLVRSLSVLCELISLHPVKLLLLGDGSARHLLESVDVECTACGSDELATEAVVDIGARLVVFDTLAFDPAAFARLPCGVQVVSLSPVFNCMEKVDHLFHRTMKLDPNWPSNGVFPRVHRGLNLTVLPSWLNRLSTAIYREHLHEERMGLAISMGGTDATNRTLELLKLFGQCSARLVIFVALGEAYTHSFEDLLTVASDNRQEIILLKSNESMWRILKNTVSLLVCAGGLTTYEAAFVGLPTINILQRADWSYLFEELVEAGACRVLLPHVASLAQAVALVEALAERRDDLAAMHLATKGLIPEGGARRIANKLHSFLSPPHS